MRHIQPNGFGVTYISDKLSASKEKESEKDEMTSLHAKLLDWLRRAENSTPEMEFRKVSAEDLDFYAGRQDSVEVLQALENQKRPCEVYNEVKPKIDMLVGLSAQVRNDMELIPVGTEDEALAELMNGVLKHFLKKLEIRDKEMEAFEYTAKAGRGLVELFVDTSNPFKPEIKFLFHKGHRFWIDPNFQEYDLSDARYLFIDRWLPEEDIKQVIPDFDGYAVQNFSMERPSDYPIFWDEASELYRLVQCWYRKTEEGYWFLSPFTGKPDFVKKNDWQKFVDTLEEINQGIDNGEDVLQNGGQKVELPTPVPGFKKFIYYAVLDGSKIHSHGVNTYWHEDFPFTFIGAYRDDNLNNWFGAITMMKDPQRGINTMRRQLVHLLQTAPKGILLHETGAVLDIEEYEKRGSDPTYHMELSAGGLGRVQFSNQPQINPIYQSFGEVCVQSMKDSSGIQDSLMGVQTSSREPGVTVRLRQETGFAVLYVLFHNFSKSRKIITKKLLALIQQYVDEPTMVRIEGQNGAMLMQVNTQLNPQVQGYNDITAGEFDIWVEEGVESTTMRMAIAQWLTDFAMNNPNVIPPDVILEYSNVPFSVKQQVKQWMAMQQQREDEFRKAELELQARELDIKEKAATAKSSSKSN
jgi:hypothetical protein